MNIIKSLKFAWRIYRQKPLWFLILDIGTDALLVAIFLWVLFRL